MTESDLITLVEIEDKFIAEDIQQLLEDYQIYSVLISDNPASTENFCIFVSTSHIKCH